MARNKNNILKRKQGRLRHCLKKFDGAVQLVTKTIDSLERINQNIADEVIEIESYQKDLELTRIGLDDARAKNNRVIANFKQLLSVD